MSTPRRYQFDNPLPAVRESALPVVYQPQPLTPQPYADPAQGQVIVQHIHQAPPDRTVQRVAFGAGVGGGAVAAGVYFGPLLVAALTSMAIDLGALAFVVVAGAWAVVTVVRSVDGHAHTKATRKALTSKKGR